MIIIDSHMVIKLLFPHYSFLLTFYFFPQCNTWQNYSVKDVKIDMIQI